MKETEKHIQRAILEWGQYKRILMHRINVIGTPLHKIPVSVWLEVKTKRGKLSPNQLLFKDSVDAFGGFYYVVRSIEDVESALAEVRQQTFQKIKDFVPF